MKSSATVLDEIQKVPEVKGNDKLTRIVAKINIDFESGNFSYVKI